MTFITRWGKEKNKTVIVRHYVRRGKGSGKKTVQLESQELILPGIEIKFPILPCSEEIMTALRDNTMIRPLRRQQ
jgi:hypothetical protein